jgi:enamine deaminase RidA (YjgF/YER057c/UK114 family)
MAVEYLNPPFLHEPVDSTYSHISKSPPGTAYRIGGQVPVDEDGNNLAPGDMSEQIRVCYECVSKSLSHVGLGWADVTHLLIFTTKVDDYIAREKSIAPQFFGDRPPPSTLVEVQRLVDPEWMVEIQADAVAPSSA